jgi:hypothetical protein
MPFIFKFTDNSNTKNSFGVIGIGVLFLISLYFGMSAGAQAFDNVAYDKKLLENANNPLGPDGVTPKQHRWPAPAVYPNAGALLPFNRIVAYYGNFYSKRMGVLGQYPPDEVIKMLDKEVAKWKAVEPTTPVIPAIDYIAVVAQHNGGKDGMYRYRMPDDQIKKALDMADQIKGLLVLDLQIGFSDVRTEIPRLESYLKLPNVMLALDPEFAMKTTGVAPGGEIGSLDASDINYAAEYLAGIVKKYNLPPKILIVHRFTQHMITNARAIKPLPEVQIVIDMDGWGYKGKKLDSYKYFVAAEPVQFTGMKIFYENDLKPPSTGLFTPDELMKLTPRPIYILYQ